MTPTVNRPEVIVHARPDLILGGTEYYWSCTCGQSSRLGTRDVVECAAEADLHQDLCREAERRRMGL